MTHTLLKGTRREIERELAEIDAQISELRMQRDTYQKCFEYEKDSNIRLETEIKRLREGVMDCLHTNRHLADGEDCTLIGLKRLLWPNF